MSLRAKRAPCRRTRAATRGTAPAGKGEATSAAESGFPQAQPGESCAAPGRGDAPRPIIAIDGPSGAGKSTAAALVAERTAFLHLDTGAMYRAVTLAAIRAGLAAPGSPPREDVLGRLALRSGFEVQRAGRRQRVLLDGEDVTGELRRPDVEALVPLVAGLPSVRRALVPWQRRMAEGGGVVADGRDMGTAVFPDAPFKFFVTADLDERARRRCRELARRGVEASLDEVRRALAERDALDSDRPVAPLVRQPEAVLVDTTGLSAEEVARRILDGCPGLAAAGPGFGDGAGEAAPPGPVRPAGRRRAEAAAEGRHSDAPSSDGGDR